MTEPITNILPKNIEPGIEELLLNFSKLAQEFVHFGTHVFKWLIEESNGGEENLPLPLIFRDQLDKADAISILIKESSIDPSKILLRSVLESYLYIDYLLEKNTLDRSMALLVYNKKKELKFYNKFKSGHAENTKFLKNIEKDKLVPSIDLPSDSEVNLAIERKNKILQLPQYRKACIEYERVESAGRKNPNWYSLFNGPSDFEQLASYLNLSFYYDILYRKWSGSVHGTDIIEGKINKSVDTTKGNIDIVQLRFPKDAQTVTSYLLLMQLETYRLIMKAKIPGKYDEFKKWYLTVCEDLHQVCQENQLIKIID